MQIKGYASFAFSGLLTFPKKVEEKIKSGKTKNNDDYLRMNIGVKANDTVAYVEAFGTKSDLVKVQYRKDEGEKYATTEFLKSDITPEIMKNISANSKLIAKFDPYIVKEDGFDKVKYKEERTFVDAHDFIVYIASKLDEKKGCPIFIGGRPEINVYEGNKTWKFRVNRIFEQMPENVRHECVLELPLVFRKDSFEDIPSIEELKKLSPSERKLGVEAYGVKYNSLLKKNELVEMPFKLNLSTLDMEDERTELILKAVKMMFQTCEGRPLSNKKYYQGVVISGYVAGREKVIEFTDEDKMCIEAGLVTEAQLLREKGGGYGFTTKEVQLTRIKAGHYLEEVEIEDTDFFIEERDTVVETKAGSTDDFSWG